MEQVASINVAPEVRPVVHVAAAGKPESAGYYASAVTLDGKRSSGRWTPGYQWHQFAVEELLAAFNGSAFYIREGFYPQAASAPAWESFRIVNTEGEA